MKGQKQELGIGKLIFELRVRKNLSEEAVSNGLCSISEFRKIETGEKLANKTLLDALLGRMGCAADNFSIILEKEQYEIYHLRNQIQKIYLREEIEELQKAMEQLKSKIIKKAGCDYQFYCKMEFLMGKYFHHTIEEMEKILISIIQITIPQFAINKILEFSFCREEILLCCLLASEYLEYGEKQKAKILLEDLLTNVEKSGWDMEEKVRFYPQIAILLFEIYDVWKENEKWIILCKKVIDLLIKNGKIILMEELLECYKIGIEEKIRKGQRKFAKIEEVIYQTICQEQKSIRELKQEYGISYRKKEVLVPNNEYYEVYLLQEIILDYRMQAGKSQSELGEALGVEWETVSRYENGRSRPNQRNYQFLVKEIGIPYEKYQVLLPVNHYIEYEKIRQIERFLFRREFILAEQLFLEIMPLIPQERQENRQYCIRTKALLDFYFNRISQKEELQQFELAIACTFPGYHAKNKNKDFLKCHIPSRYEAILFNHIITIYSDMGDQDTAIKMLQAIIEVFQKSKIQEEYHISSLSLLLVTYSECLSRQGNYQEALEKIEKVFQLDLAFGRGNMLPYLCYMKGWNQMKKEGNSLSKAKRNACMKYYQQAYWLSGFLQDYILQATIEELYKKDFGQTLI